MKISCNKIVFLLQSHWWLAVLLLLLPGISQATSDADLKRWLNHHVSQHPSVLAAQAAVDAAGFQLAAADKALFNPELELDAETAETDSAYVGISQTIDWGDVRGARTSRASAERMAARMAYESTRRDIAAQLLASLANVHTTAALKDLAQQGNTLMQRSARLARQRYEAGDLGQVEVDLANLSFAQARFRLADAVAEHARARASLLALTGYPQGGAGLDTDISQWPALQFELPAPDSGKMDSRVQQLPQMREIVARVNAAKAEVKQRMGEKSVTPTVALRAGREEQDTLLGINLSIPLHVRNNFRAEVDAANAGMIQAEKASIDAYRQLKSRLQMAAVSYQLSREAWLSWQQSGEGTLGEQIKLLQRLWQAGEISTTDYLVQLNQALQTKASAIEQRGRMWTDWSEWLQASGDIEHWLTSAGETK